MLVQRQKDYSNEVTNKSIYNNMRLQTILYVVYIHLQNAQMVKQPFTYVYKSVDQTNTSA